MTSNRMVCVGEIARYGRNSRGIEWHTVNFNNDVDIPAGSKVYILAETDEDDEDQYGQRIIIRKEEHDGKIGVIINSAINGEVRYYVVALEDECDSLIILNNGEFDFV